MTLGGAVVRLIYLGAAFVIGGAAMMLVSFYGEGPTVITDIGKILAFLGFVVYAVGRIRYHRIKKTRPRQEPAHEDDSE